MDHLIEPGLSGADLIKDVGNFIVLSALIPLIGFIYRYTRYSPFEKTILGKNYLIQKVAFTLVFLLILLGLFVPDLFLREWFRLFIYLAVVATFWGDLVYLLRVQRQYPYKRPKGSLKALFFQNPIKLFAGYFKRDKPKSDKNYNMKDQA